MRKFILAVLFTSISVVAYAQVPYNKENLQKQNAQLKKEIQQLNKELSKNREESKLSVVYVQNLDKKIKTQSTLIGNLQKEKRVMDDEIYLTQLEINKLGRELLELKKEYKEILIKAYKNKSTENKLLFVLSSKSLTQAYRRVKYLEKYSEYQLSQADEIKVKRLEIEKKKAQREKAKLAQEKVISQHLSYSNELDGEKKAKEEVVASFRANAEKIAVELKNKESEQKRVDTKIKEIIEEEIRLAKIRAEKDKKAWDIARKSNTIASYQKYLSEFEKGDYSTSAKKEITRIEADTNAWSIARSSHTKVAYQNYLNNYGKGLYAITARTEILKFEKFEKEQEEERKRLEAAKALAASKPSEAAKVEKIERKIETEKAPEPEKTPKPDYSQMTAYADRSSAEGLSGEFSSNRGRLPWPVQRGNVVSHFGTNSHPVLPQLTIENSGVDISTSRGAKATSVFDGEVLSVMVIPGGNRAVMIKHGGYFTVYYNLSSVMVSKGDQIKRGQQLGTIYTTDDGQTILNFQVWSGTIKQNPAYWVAGM